MKSLITDIRTTLHRVAKQHVISKEVIKASLADNVTPRGKIKQNNRISELNSEEPHMPLEYNLECNGNKERLSREIIH